MNILRFIFIVMPPLGILLFILTASWPYVYEHLTPRQKFVYWSGIALSILLALGGLLGLTLL